MTTTVLAHAAGVPVEELLPLALAAGTTASVGVRIAWARLRRRTAGRARRRSAPAPSAPAAPRSPRDRASPFTP